MRRKLGRGTVLLAVAALLLVLATANEIDTRADAHERGAADKAAFARHAERWHGGFGHVHVARHRRFDVACARHTTGRRFKLCVRVPHGGG